ncbi:MAG TPA: DUF2283 domain-containing protein [Thermodesulfovibrionia bacterium]|nr:DUF2283 domain-containing protein [Thermodesulfovibrionia bacterium]
MKIYFDDKNDLLYIRFDDKKQEIINQRVSDEIALDIGEDERIVGIEILNASKRVALNTLLPVEYKHTAQLRTIKAFIKNSSGLEEIIEMLDKSNLTLIS